MGFFEAFFRGLAFLAAAAASVVIVATIGGNISDMQVASINAETTQTLFVQQQETIRWLATVNGQTTIAAIQGQTAQTWAREVGDAARTWAIMLAVAAVGSVIAWQGAKTVRHWMTERNRERAILVAFGAEFFPDAPPGAIRIDHAGADRMIRNYVTRQQWTLPAAQVALAQRGRLTVDAE